MLKKRAISMLSLMVVFVLIISACAPAPSATQAVKPGATAAPATSAANVSGPNQFPVVKERITIKALINPTSMIKDFENNEFTKWVEEKTNINLEIEVPPMAEAQQKLNLILASDDLPEVIIGFGIPLDQQLVLSQQGVILPLNDLIEKYGYEFKNVLKDMPQVKDLITMPDGKIYGLPHINDCYHCSMSQKMWVYKPWLDKLGLKEPTTTEEFYEMLKAFKTKDPNGNGKADEIPLSGTRETPGGWRAQLDSFLMNSFVYNDRVTPNNALRHLFLENGTVKASYTEPGWKEGLKYYAKLYAEGLIDPQAFTNDNNKIRQLGENPDIPILGAVQAGWYGVFTQNGGPSGRWKEYIPIKPLKGPTGMQQTPLTIYQSTGGQANFVITKKAKNPEAAMRLADLFYGFDATTRSVFGPEGEDWVRAKDTDVSISGGKALYTVLKVWSGEEHNRHWNQAAPTYRTNAYRMAQTYNEKDPLERWLFEWTKNLYEPFGTKDKNLPPLVLTRDQSRTFGEVRTAVYNTVDEWFANFVTGKNNVDKDWDAYLKLLKDSGNDTMLKVLQDAYNAKYKK